MQKSTACKRKFAVVFSCVFFYSAARTMHDENAESHGRKLARRDGNVYRKNKPTIIYSTVQW